jgi:hypothetical protein
MLGTRRKSKAVYAVVVGLIVCLLLGTTIVVTVAIRSRSITTTGNRDVCASLDSIGLTADQILLSPEAIERLLEIANIAQEGEAGNDIDAAAVRLRGVSGMSTADAARLIRDLESKCHNRGL